MNGNLQQDCIAIASAVEAAGAQLAYNKMITDQKARVAPYNKRTAAIASYQRFEEVAAIDVRGVDTANQWAQDVVEGMEGI